MLHHNNENLHERQTLAGHASQDWCSRLIGYGCEETSVSTESCVALFRRPCRRSFVPGHVLLSGTCFPLGFMLRSSVNRMDGVQRTERQHSALSVYLIRFADFCLSLRYADNVLVRELVVKFSNRSINIENVIYLADKKWKQYI